MATQKRRSFAAAARTARLEQRRAQLRARRAADFAAKRVLDLDQAFADARKAQRHATLLSAQEAARNNRPFLACLAQGDSWFNYSACGRSIITDLEGMLGDKGGFYNLAQPGRLMRDMLTGQLRKDFEEELSKGLGRKYPWNVVLLSGGGNDICGNGTFVDWLEEYDGGAAPEPYIASAFRMELKHLEDLYDEAATLVATRAPAARLFVHGYDFAIPDGRCVQVLRHCFAGPWMRPAFEKRGFQRKMDAGHLRSRLLSSSYCYRAFN